APPRYSWTISRHHAGRSWATLGSDVPTATRDPAGSGSSASRSSISSPSPIPRAPPSTRAAWAEVDGGTSSSLIGSASSRSARRPLPGQPLRLDRVEEYLVPLEDLGGCRDPALQPLQVHH